MYQLTIKWNIIKGGCHSFLYLFPMTTKPQKATGNITTELAQYQVYRTKQDFGQLGS